MAVTTSQVQQLYIAYFNRPADFFGLTFQTAQANQFGLQFVADQFSKSPEYLATYAGLGIGDVVNTIYKNLFGREAEPAGLKFWGDLLTNPKSGVTLGNAALTIATGAINADRVSVDNKLAAANAFYASLDTNAEIVGYSGDAANQVLKTWMTGITTQATLDAAITPAALLTVSTAATAAHDGVVNVITTALTAGADNFAGTAANDTINAVRDTTVGGVSTLTALDVINGGAGIDTLNINDLNPAGSGLPAGLVVSNVENVSLRGAGAVNFNSSTWVGVNTLKVVQATTATVTAAGTTAIEVTGATGAIVVDGGASQTVTTSASTIALGGTTVAAGAISATHTAQATNSIAVDGGSTVAVTATGATTGTIAVGMGGAATDLATGAITVNSTGAASVAATAVTHGAIQVKGGSSVVVTEKATSSDAAALTDTTGSTTTQSAISVTGGAATTSVTVAQSAAVAATAAIAAIAGVKEVQTFTFSALTVNQTLIINGLTFTASKALTATEAAAAFANIAAGATQGNAPAGNGIYTGAASASFVTGPVVASGTAKTVVFTAADTTGGDLALLANTGTGTATVAGNVDGVAALDATDGVLGIVGGTVAVDGNITNADVLGTVTLDGYGATSTVKSDALTSLSLANSDSGVAVTNGTATTLALSVNNLGVIAGATADLGGTYTTLNIAANGANSKVAVTAGGVQALAVSGTKVADLSSSVLGSLKTVTVTGSAGVKVDASGANVTSVDASGTSGANTVTINAANATYVGGSGTDSVTLSTATTTKAVSLGDGNDTLTLAATTTSLTANMDGGNGTDTLKMAAADAATASATTTFATKIDSFEKLSLGAVATTTTATVDLANIDNINYVVTAGGAATSALVLNHFGANGTVEFTGAAVATTVSLNDATGTADALNIITKVSTAALDFGVVTAAGVESIALTVSDTSTSAGIQTATLALKDAALKSVVVTGNGHLALTNDANVVALTSLDGSAMTGKLTASTNGTVAETIKGGAAADILTAVGNADVLIGGAGADTLIVTGNLATLTGGAGNDTFNIADATTNVNSYATITDLTAGDKIQFAATGVTFNASKVSLSDTAVFQDYANAAVTATANGDIAWFQYGGNTYVIEHVSGTTSFVNNSDIIVKITGAVDLSTASFSASSHTLLIA